MFVAIFRPRYTLLSTHHISKYVLCHISIRQTSPYAVGVTDTNYFTIRESSDFSVHYLSGILNSTAGQFFHKRRAKLKRANYYEYFVEDLDSFPVPPPSCDQRASMEINNCVRQIITTKYDSSAYKIFFEQINDAAFFMYGINRSTERQLIERLFQWLIEL